MNFPTLSEYEDLFHSRKTFKRLGAEEFEFADNNGVFVYSSGTFAAVAKVRRKESNEQFAIRFPLRSQPNVVQRYQNLSRFLSTGKLIEQNVVDFAVWENEFFFNEHQIPVIRMEWISAPNLGDFVEDSCRSGQIANLVKVRALLRELSINAWTDHFVHGDLSPENILVEGSGENARIRLVDYDSVMFAERNAEGRLIIDEDMRRSEVGIGPLRHPMSDPRDLCDDLFAFAVYELGLSLLILKPQLGMSVGGNGRSFLIGATEILGDGDQTIVGELSARFPKHVEILRRYLRNDYRSFSEIMPESFKIADSVTAFQSGAPPRVVSEIDSFVSRSSEVGRDWAQEELPEFWYEMKSGRCRRYYLLDLESQFSGAIKLIVSKNLKMIGVDDRQVLDAQERLINQFIWLSPNNSCKQDESLFWHRDQGAESGRVDVCRKSVKQLVIGFMDFDSREAMFESVQRRWHEKFLGGLRRPDSSDLKSVAQDFVSQLLRERQSVDVLRSGLGVGAISHCFNQWGVKIDNQIGQRRASIQREISSALAEVNRELDGHNLMINFERDKLFLQSRLDRSE